MDQSTLKLIIEDSSEKRLDRYLASVLPDYSRNFIKKLFEAGHIWSEVKLELKKMPPVGTEIIIDIPPPIPSEAQAENIPLNILYEDEHLLFIDKSPGMVVHPAPGNYTGTLVNALLYHCQDLNGVGNVQRPGIVHRLDKGTSGVMVVAKHQKALEKLISTFSAHKLQRDYLALCWGELKRSAGKVESLIERSKKNRLKMTSQTQTGKTAITHYQLMKREGKLNLIRFTLETGRTHQIRVHATEQLKVPLICDPTYGNANAGKLPTRFKELLIDQEYPLLHATKLELEHPISGKLLSFQTLPPAPFSDCIDLLNEIDQSSEQS